MTRLALLPENDIATRVKALLSEIEALKTAQALGGDSIQRYTIQTGNPWDIAPFVVPAGVHTYVWRVTMHADHPNLLPYSEIWVTIQWVGARGANQELVWADDADGLPYNGNRQMLVYFYNTSGEATSINLQFVFNSGDTGYLDWLQIQ